MIHNIKFRAFVYEDESIDEYALITFLESLENLIALKYLLENKKKIVAISKTSSSNKLFHANIPDLAILDGMTRKQGFSEPYHRKVTYKTKHDFPIENEFFRELWFTIFFARSISEGAASNLGVKRVRRLSQLAT